MKLIEVRNKLNIIKKNLSGNVGILGYYEEAYYYLQQFRTFAYLNSLHCYYNLSRIPNHLTLQSVLSEIDQQLVTYQYYPELAMIAPQKEILTRHSVCQIKFLEIAYNEKYNTIILS